MTVPAEALHHLLASSVSECVYGRGVVRPDKVAALTDAIINLLGAAQTAPENVTPAMVSAGMGEIPEDGCEYEHVEAAYLAMRAVAQAPPNPDAVEMYRKALNAANMRIAELEAQNWDEAFKK